MLEQLAFQSPAVFKNLKYLLFGGDIANRKAIKLIIEAGKPQHIINCYGPTESTTIASIYEIQAQHCDTAIPIGKPIDNTNIYILDNNGHPVPNGVIGEMHICGKGLASGYLNLPEQTARQFITITHNGVETKAYRSGDYAYQDHNGTLHFVGRDDEQVKLMGHRTELQEIKQKIIEYPTIKQVEVIIKRDSVTAFKQVIAYIVAETTVSRDDLQDYLKNSLPSYMIPTHFYQLDKLPMSTNGKLDTKAIITLEPMETKPKKINIRIEDIICEIFSELLSLPVTDINDESFINLGGSSILLVKLVDIIRKRFDIELGIEQFFNANKPSIIAKKIRAIKQTEITTNKYNTLLKAIPGKDNSKPPIVFIHPAGGSIFYYQTIIEELSELGNPIYMISEPSIKLGYAVFEDLAQTADCYHKLIKSQCSESNNIILGGYSLGGMIAAAISLIAEQENDDNFNISEMLLLDTWIITRANKQQISALKKHLNDKFDYHQAGSIGPFLYELFQYWQDIGLKYTPNRSIKTPTCLFRSDNSINDLTGINLSDISNDWTIYCKNIEIVSVVGTHDSIMQKPHVFGLIKAIKTHLNKNSRTTSRRVRQSKQIFRKIITRKHIDSLKTQNNLNVLPFF